MLAKQDRVGSDAVTGSNNNSPMWQTLLVQRTIIPFDQRSFLMFFRFHCCSLLVSISCLMFAQMLFLRLLFDFAPFSLLPLCSQLSFLFFMQLYPCMRNNVRGQRPNFSDRLSRLIGYVSSMVIVLVFGCQLLDYVSRSVLLLL